METPGGPCLAIWGRGEALDLTSRMVLGRSELPVLRQNEHIFNRKCLCHFCGSHPYFQREGFVSSSWSSTTVGEFFFLPSLYLSYSLVYSGCWYSFHLSSLSFLPFPPGNGDMGP